MALATSRPDARIFWWIEVPRALDRIADVLARFDDRVVDGGAAALDGVRDFAAGGDDAVVHRAAAPFDLAGDLAAGFDDALVDGVALVDDAVGEARPASTMRSWMVVARWVTVSEISLPEAMIVSLIFMPRTAIALATSPPTAARRCVSSALRSSNVS